MKTQILICGGGPAGFSAAIAASRLGAEVLLIERYGFLGGNLTAGFVNPFMHFHSARRDSFVEQEPKEEPIIKGIFAELIEKLKNENAYLRQSFDVEIAKYLLLKMAKENGVKLLLHSFVFDIEVQDSLIKAVWTVGKSGKIKIDADIFIDATGDADVAALAGCPFEKGRSSDGLMQPMTLHFSMAGVEADKMPSRLEINKIYQEAKRKGEISVPRETLLWFHTPRQNEIHFNTTRVVKVDGTNVFDLTKAEIEAREQVWQTVNFLKKNISGFENSYLASTGTQIGVRETRRIIGEYVLTEEDVLNGRKFTDAICRGSYEIDIHNPAGSGTTIKFLPVGTFYEISYRCLVPKKIINLIVAGRPISVTHEAHSSTRIMPICMGLGQAAGIAAYLVIKNKAAFSQINAEQIRDLLRLQNQII